MCRMQRHAAEKTDPRGHKHTTYDSRDDCVSRRNPGTSVFASCSWNLQTVVTAHCTSLKAALMVYARRWTKLRVRLK